MKAQNLLDMADREGSIQVDDYEIWIYTQSAIVEDNGSEFAEPNSHEEKGDINLLTAPYWWVSVGIGVVLIQLIVPTICRNIWIDYQNNI